MADFMNFSEVGVDTHYGGDILLFVVTEQHFLFYDGAESFDSLNAAHGIELRFA